MRALSYTLCVLIALMLATTALGVKNAPNVTVADSELLECADYAITGIKWTRCAPNNLPEDGPVLRNVVLTWDTPTEYVDETPLVLSDISHYVIDYALVGDSYVRVVVPVSNTATITSLPSGTYNFRIAKVR